MEVTVLVVAVVLGMSPWFSATVVAPAIIHEAGGSEGLGIWLTLSVQLGFVLGSVAIAAGLLADRWSPTKLAAGSAAVATAATACLAVPGIGVETLLALRLLAGAAMAGTYPPAIKIAAGWTSTHRGLAIGVLVAGTTLGAALPHLLRALTNPNAWRMVVVLSAACAAAGALLFAFRVREGPYQGRSAPFDPRALRAVFTNRGVMLATGGYLGHMWELYAMWSSIGVFTAYCADRYGWSAAQGAMLAFSSVAAGALGAVQAGVAADRVGRSTVTIVAMTVSGACAILIGPAAGVSSAALLILTVVWGASVVADSAQFSAAVTEFAAKDYVGTAVTVQTALGFLLTMVTIRLVPTWTQLWGWSWAFAPLAAGPLVGAICMSRLRRLERLRGGAW